MLRVRQKIFVYNLPLTLYPRNSIYSLKFLYGKVVISSLVKSSFMDIL